MRRDLGPRPGVWVGSLALCVGTLCACGRDDAKPAAPAAGTVTLDRTTFAAHTRVPLAEGRNVVYCATFQLAWDALADAIGGGKLDLGAPAPAVDVTELNRRAFPHGDLDPKACVFAGGLVRDGVLDRIVAEMRAKFPTVPPPALAAGPEDAVGFAYLAKDLKFAIPFESIAQPLRFRGGKKLVRAFGLEADAKGPAAERVMAQIVWYFAPPRSTFLAVTELLLDSGGDRLLLARMPAPATLEDAWQSVVVTLENDTKQILKPDDNEFVVPMIDFDATHRFSQFVGAALGGSSGGFIREAMQGVRFRLDRTGAVVRSEAEIVGYLGTMDMRFDQPFLLALLQKGAKRPYFLLWIGNDDLLVASELKPDADITGFVGAWRMTPRAGGERPGEGESVTLTIRGDRTAVLQFTVKNPGPRTIEGRVEVDGEQVFFAPVTIDGSPATGKAASSRIPMVRSDAGLSLGKGRKGMEFTPAR